MKNRCKSNISTVVIVGLIALVGGAAPSDAATLFSTDVNADNWVGSSLAEDFVYSQEFTLTSVSEISSIKWTGRYCYLDGSGCLKPIYDAYGDNISVSISGVDVFFGGARSSDQNWSSSSAIYEYTLDLSGLKLEAGTYSVSIKNQVFDPEVRWYWNLRGDFEAPIFSLDVNGTALQAIPLPMTGLLLAGGLGALGLVRKRNQS